MTTKQATPKTPAPKRGTKTPAPKTSAPTEDLTADEVASILDAANTVTAARKATTIDDAKWQHLWNQFDAMSNLATVLVRVIGSKLPGEATGNAMHTEATTPGRHGYIADAAVRKALGTAANYTRAMQVKLFDDGTRDASDETSARARFRKDGNPANVQDFIGWSQIMRGTAQPDTLARFTVTIDDDGTKHAKVTPKTPAPKVKTVNTAVTKLVADGIDAWTATLDAPGFDVNLLPPARWDEIALRLVAAIQLRDAAATPKTDAPASDADMVAAALAAR